jgi:hypothetical protein
MEETKILDWNSYPKEDIRGIKHLTAYFINIIYNHLYEESVKLKNSSDSRYESITDAYKHSLVYFADSIGVKKYRNGYINGICQYFESCGYVSSAPRDQISKLSEIFIPAPYRKNFNIPSRIAFFMDTLKNVIRSLIEDIIKNELIRIVDHHNISENVDILQENCINFFIIEREKSYIKFIDKRKNKEGETVKKLQGILVRALKDCSSTKSDNIKMVKLLKAEKSAVKLLKGQVKSWSEKYSQSQKTVASLNETNSYLQSRLTSVTHDGIYEHAKPNRADPPPPGQVDIKTKSKKSPLTNSRNSIPLTNSRNSIPLTNSRNSSPLTNSRNSSPLTNSRNSSPLTNSRNSIPLTNSGSQFDISNTSDDSFPGEVLNLDAWA